MGNEKNTRIKLYVLNDYLKFERKIYQIFGLAIGRPIKIKTILYVVIILVAVLAIYFTPIIGNLINWIPTVYLIVIPAVLGYVLSDIRTEGRLPIAFFRSMFLYALRKTKAVTYRRGREIKKLTTYNFEGYSTVTFAEDRTDDVFIPRMVKFKTSKKGVGVSQFIEKHYEKRNRIKQLEGEFI